MDDPQDELGGAAARLNGDVVAVELWYPRHRQAKKVSVGLVDVRAADDLLIEYDFERDGWSIKQASRFAWTIDDSECDPDWQEVAFIQAWAREESDEEQERRVPGSSGSRSPQEGS